ncbi:MAG: hypothetical protein HYW89_01955 [Candidatus Sungiibacteriota bacterium]|uniref:DUF502 domain-containing protein n=1 Tax=Candidatus Sungiibacteriota bacterium TaxID=2750080 RepID=A0A7T5RK95_9BACT|nr:MAG: hypothetical protein HYW89_01955 [Candidatus Sungbacteria bacterium]
MRKYTWPVFVGFITLLMLLLPIKLVGVIVTYFDDLWNVTVWQPFLGRSLPLAGLIASVVIFYLVGKLAETKWGIWVNENILQHIPILGGFLSSFNPNTKKVLEETNGFIIARYLSEWRPAKLMSVLKKKDGYFGVVMFFTFPPTPQFIPDDSPIYVLENPEGKYDVIPNRVAFKLEVSAGTAVPENCIEGAVLTTMGEFIRARNLIRKPNPTSNNGS